MRGLRHNDYINIVMLIPVHIAVHILPKKKKRNTLIIHRYVCFTSNRSINYERRVKMKRCVLEKAVIATECAARFLTK